MAKRMLAALLIIFTTAVVGKGYAANKQPSLTGRNAYISAIGSGLTIKSEKPALHTIQVCRISNTQKIKSYSTFGGQVSLFHKRENYTCSSPAPAYMLFPDAYLFFIYPSHNFW